MSPFRAGVVKRGERRVRENEYYSSAMTIANLLFPKNFPKQIASAAPKSRTTFSERVKLTAKSQRVIENFYKTGGEKLFQDYSVKYNDAAENKINVKLLCLIFIPHRYKIL